MLNREVARKKYIHVGKNTSGKSKLKGLAAPSVFRDMENNLHIIKVGIQNAKNCFEKLVVSLKLKHRSTICSNYPAFSIFPREMEAYVKKKRALYTNVQSSFMYS